MFYAYSTYIKQQQTSGERKMKAIKATKTQNKNGSFRVEVINENGEVILICKASKNVKKYIGVYVDKNNGYTTYEKTNTKRPHLDSFKDMVMQIQLEVKEA